MFGLTAKTKDKLWYGLISFFLFNVSYLMMFFGERLPIAQNVFGPGMHSLWDAFFHSIAFQLGYLVPISVLMIINNLMTLRTLRERFYKGPKKAKENFWVSDVFIDFMVFDVLMFSLPILVGTGLFLATTIVPATAVALTPYIAALFIGTFSCQSLRQLMNVVTKLIVQRTDDVKENGKLQSEALTNAFQFLANASNLYLLILIFGSLLWPKLILAMPLQMTVFAGAVTFFNLIVAGRLTMDFQQTIAENEAARIAAGAAAALPINKPPGERAVVKPTAPGAGARNDKAGDDNDEKARLLASATVG